MPRSSDGAVDMVQLENITHGADAYITDGNLVLDVGGQQYVAYDLSLDTQGIDCQSGRVRLNDDSCGKWNSAVSESISSLEVLSLLRNLQEPVII